MELPVIGLGTYNVTYETVLNALKLGYRHLDTAASYDTEELVGRAIRHSGIPRDQLYVTTKLRTDAKRVPVPQALDQSLAALGLDYVDLYLMHWPVAFTVEADGHRTIDPTWDFRQIWLDMQKLLATGKVRAIGVSNFSISKLEALRQYPGSTVVPAVNQLELHPHLPQHDMLEYSRGHGIKLVAYAPLGGWRDTAMLEHPAVAAIAQARKVTPAQVLLGWAVWRGTYVIPKSSQLERLRANLEYARLTDEEAKSLDGLATRRFNDYDWDYNVFE